MKNLLRWNFFKGIATVENFGFIQQFNTNNTNIFPYNTDNTKKNMQYFLHLCGIFDVSI